MKQREDVIYLKSLFFYYFSKLIKSSAMDARRIEEFERTMQLVQNEVARYVQQQSKMYIDEDIMIDATFMERRFLTDVERIRDRCALILADSHTYSDDYSRQQGLMSLLHAYKFISNYTSLQCTINTLPNIDSSILRLLEP
jgi:hypothetical protein